MRVAAVLITVVALAAGAASTGGAATSSHKGPAARFRGAIAPSWSPDGKQIAYVSVRYVRRENCCHLPPFYDAKSYRVVRTSSRAGGAVHTVLGSYGYCCAAMQWAAGGRILLNPNVGLKSVGARRGGLKRLVFPRCAGEPDPGHSCQTLGFFLSPNREYAAARVSTDFTDPHIAWGIGLVSLLPGRVPAVLPTPLPTEEEGSITDSVLAFSPDSTQVVFDRFSWDGWTAIPEGLFALPVGGGDPVPLAQTAIPGATLLPDEVQQLQWSPDGRWIAFVKSEKLNVVSTTGASAPVVLRCGNGGDSWDFAWSPASDRLAYDCADYFEKKWTYRFMTVAPDGTNGADLLQGHRLPYAHQPQWSPDGSRLLFVAPRIGHRPTHVWTIRPDGRGLTLIG